MLRLLPEYDLDQTKRWAVFRQYYTLVDLRSYFEYNEHNKHHKR